MRWPRKEPRLWETEPGFILVLRRARIVLILLLVSSRAHVRHDLDGPHMGRDYGGAMPVHRDNADENAPSVHAVLLYDGECGLCNACVRLLLRMDRRERLHFAPLQGEIAQRYLRQQGLPTEDFDSMIFIPDWPRRSTILPRFRTDAALAAAGEAGGILSILTIFRVVPRPIRDAFYKLVARFRYQLFGEYRPRPLPRPEWNARILS